MQYTTHNRLLHALCCSLFLFSLAGCGGEYRKVYGVVTLDGEPLETGRVKFFPETGRPAVGKIMADGKYTLTTIDPGDGAKPGDYTVTVEATEHSATGQFASSLEEELTGVGANVRMDSKRLVPPHYSNRGDTPLKVTVKKSGSNEIDLALERSR